MKKQRICIIGDGLSGLVTCLAMKDTGLSIDLYSSPGDDNFDKRITAISESNFVFLKSLEKKLNLKLFWKCNKINLYYENDHTLSNFLNFNKNEKSLMHIFENHKLKQSIKKILKHKDIKFKKARVDLVNHKDSFIKVNQDVIYYDLIILCLGARSSLYDNLTKNRSIRKDYREVAITGSITHNFKLINPRQYFLREGPLAFLPINKKIFSFVWSLNKTVYKENEKNLKKFVINKIKNVTNKKVKLSISKINSFPINLNLQKNYYKKNVLILGEGLHSVHPIAGQGFNLVLRDINKLRQLIRKNLRLGLNITNSFIFEDFYKDRKFENTIMGLGIDLTNSFFKKNKYFDPIKNVILKNISKSNTIKNLSKMLSDKGMSI